MRGLPGSGKSTWAREQLARFPGRFKRINRDELRLMLDNGVHSQTNEIFVLHVRDSLIRSALEHGYDVIVDDTNLNPRQLEHLRQLVAPLAECHIQDFTHVPLEVCIERDSQRPQPVGEAVIRAMYHKFLETDPESGRKD